METTTSTKQKEEKIISKTKCQKCNQPTIDSYCHSCKTTHALYCPICKDITCEYTLHGGENDPEVATTCKKCNKITYF